METEERGQAELFEVVERERRLDDTVEGVLKFRGMDLRDAHTRWEAYLGKGGLSVSAASSWSNCKAAAYLYRVTKEAGDNEANLLGGAVHETIEAWTKLVMAGREGETTLKELWKAQVVKEPRLGHKGFRLGLTLLDNFLSASPLPHPLQIKDVELVFRIERPGLDYALYGLMDLVYHTHTPSGPVVVVRDYKTSFLIKGEEELAEDLQARVYAWAALELFPEVERVKVEFVFLRHGAVTRLMFERGELDEDMAYMDTVWVSMTAEEEFAPTLHHFCAWCPFMARCGLWAGEGGVPPASPRGGGGEEESMIAEWSRVSSVAKTLYARKKALGKQLMTQMKREGVTMLRDPDSGATVRLNERRTRRYHKSLVRDLLALGMSKGEVFEALNFDAEVLEQVVRRWLIGKDDTVRQATWAALKGVDETWLVDEWLGK